MNNFCSAATLFEYIVEKKDIAMRIKTNIFYVVL